MRILQINNFEAISGGSDRVYQLSTRLLLDRGHEVATLACGDQSFDTRKHTVLLKPNGYFEHNLLATARNIRNFIYRPEAARALEVILENFRPDVVHLHIFYGQLSSSVLRSLRTAGVPTVMTVHEYRMLCPVSTLFSKRLGICERCAGGNYHQAVLHRCNRNSLAISLLSALESKIRDRYFNYLEYVDHFFMVSRFCLNKHLQYLPAIAAKSSVLYNFVETTLHKDTLTAQRHFLYCGRLSHEKGIVMMCEVFSKRPTSVLLIAGDGSLNEELRARFGSLTNIRFLGKLGTEPLQACIREAWFTIAPSEWYENNPMAILESFSQGTPVIGARIGGIPELVIHDGTGLLFEPSNPSSLDEALNVAESLTDQERRKIANQALALVSEQHSADHHFNQLIAGYDAAISSHLSL